MKGQRLEIVAMLAALFFVVYCISLIVFLLAGCTAATNVAGDVTEFVACPTDLIDCGHVYMCEQTADNELGRVEICIDDDDDPDALASAERKYGACVPTPRHQGLCIYCCGANCGRGANAFNGTWCP